MAKNQNRRTFIKVAGTGLLAGIAILWDQMIKRDQLLARPQSVTIPLDLNKEVSFHKNFIVVNQGGNLRVLSSKCTHLGCAIQTVAEEQLICPCHGSTFQLDGTPTKGPALSSLPSLDYSIDETAHTITVKL